MNRFLVFVRAERQQWELHGVAMSDLSVSVGIADKAVEGRRPQKVDRAVVMEVSGTDAVPAFTYRYGTKS